MTHTQEVGSVGRWTRDSNPVIVRRSRWAVRPFMSSGVLSRWGWLRERFANPRRTGSDDGATLVEFAFVVPVLIALLLGLIDFGWSWSQDLSVKHAAREGARLAAVNAESYTNTTTSVQNFAALCTMIRQRVSSELNGTLTISFSFPGGTSASGDTGVITVSYPRASLTGFTKALNGGTMTSSLQFRMEQDANWVAGATCP